ncbi:DgyrCDS78 [Dimorphilus gyrociliatus]|nr:DgyrCDS78 [Dimorphilus gyrociliatus]
MNIPILSPANIKGSNDYRCSSCSASFQHPNVLKAHIRFKCSSNLGSLLGGSDEPLNLSKRTSIQQQQHQPIQIFNHIHAPAFALPAALLYPTLYPTSTPFYPQFLTSGPSPPAPQVKNEPNTETHLPPTFPLPSEKDGEPIDLLPRSLYMNKSNKGHLCIYCGKLYSRKYGLKIHLRTHTGYKPLKCKICLRPFGDPSNLNKHIRLHAEGDTPYRCHLCGKVLVRRRDLDRHIRSRHPVDSTKNHSDSLPPEEEEEEEMEELEAIEGELSDGGVADDEEEIEVVV